MADTSRREIIAAAAAAVSLPAIEAALGTLRSAKAEAAATAPATATAPAPARGGVVAANAAKDEPAGWFATKLKSADVKDGEFTDVEGHVVAISRTGKQITAVTTKCTHMGCKIAPKAGEKLLTCPCHGGQFNLDGTVAKAPPRNPLVNYAVRVNDTGLIEVDPGTKVTKDSKDFSITVA